MLPRRIIATETEYSAAIQPDEFSDLLTLRVEDANIDDYVPPAYAGIGKFIRNGSRFYMDVGSHPEYAAAEDDSTAGAVVNEIVGERITYATMQELVRRKGYAGFALNKRVVDHTGTSWGYHENYSCDRLTFGSDQLIATLGLHIATRTLFAGAGSLNRKGNFSLAQKAQILTESACLGTTNGTKPLISIRDEPHADDKRWGRIHVVGGDPNISPWATWMKLGTTALVVDMVEMGYTTEKLRSVPDMQHIMARQVAADTTLSGLVNFSGGIKARPLDAQIELYQAARKMGNEIELGEEKEDLLAEWERALRDLESGGQAIRDRADWPMRQRILDRHRQNLDRSEVDGSVTMADQDYTFDTLHPNGYGMMLRQKLWRQWMPDEAVLADRMVQPGQTTRAALRSRFIKHALWQTRKGGFAVEWSKVVLSDGQHVPLPDPFAATNIRLDSYMRSPGPS